jgi:hypothetical protein
VLATMRVESIEFGAGATVVDSLAPLALHVGQLLFA